MKNSFITSVLFAILCLSFVNPSSATYIDTVQGSISGGGLIIPGREAGVTFKTGSSGPFNITDLKLYLMNENFSSSLSFTFDVRLRAVGASPNYFPIGADLATTNLTTSTMAANTVALLDFNTLGSLGSYSLNANTNYALVLGNASSSSLAWKTLNGSPVTSDGFSVLNASAYNNSVWYNLGQGNWGMAISGSAIPEPSSFGLLGIGLGLLAFTNHRKTTA